jgi:hypothetical protein
MPNDDDLGALTDQLKALVAKQGAADSSLIFFFLRLLHRLQQIATVPAIDYVEYSALLVTGRDEAAEATVQSASLRR